MIMKMTKKVLVMLLSLILAFTAITPVYAQAVPEGTVCQAGDVVTVEFQYEDIVGINGVITVSGDDIIDDIALRMEATDAGFTGDYNEGNNAVAYYGPKLTDCTIILTVTVAADAKAGQSCEITFEYESTVDGDLPTEPVYESDVATITIIAIDYTELLKQIGIAEGLNEDEYTPESWAEMIKALEAGKALVNNAKTQEEVDAAAKALEDAIAALVKVTAPTPTPEQPTPTPEEPTPTPEQPTPTPEEPTPTPEQPTPTPEQPTTTPEQPTPTPEQPTEEPTAEPSVTPDGDNDNEIPTTGDTVWIALAVLAIVALAGCVILYNKKRKTAK